MRITRIILKLAFIGYFFIFQGIEVMGYYKEVNTVHNKINPIPPGIYDVTAFILNKDTIQPASTDSLRWRDLIIEKDGSGSVGSTDNTFRQRYRRGYFLASVDSAQKLIKLKKGEERSGAFFQYRLWFSKLQDLRDCLGACDRQGRIPQER